MSKLRELQLNLQDYLLTQKTDVCEQVLIDADTDSYLRLNIYRDGYYLRLLETLETDYPVLALYLGKKKFTAVGYAYIAAYPSKFFSLLPFSQYMPQFIRAYFPTDAALAELVDFEYALTQAKNSCPITPLKMDVMAEILPQRWPDLYFILHDSCQQLTLYSNAVLAWKNWQQKKKLPKLTLATSTTVWLVTRKNVDPIFYSLNPAQAYMLNAMQENKNFAEICAGLCAFFNEETVAMEAAKLLKRCFIDEMIIAIK